MGRRRRGVRGPSAIGQLIGAAMGRRRRGVRDQLLEPFCERVDAERQLLELFCEHVEREDRIPPPVLQYFAGKFEKLLAGKARPSRLFLVKPPHRPRGSSKVSSAHVAAFVYACVRGGMTRKGAIRDALEHFTNVKKSTIEKAVRNYVGDVEGEFRAALPGSKFRDARDAFKALFPEERRARPVLARIDARLDRERKRGAEEQRRLEGARRSRAQQRRQSWFEAFRAEHRRDPTDNDELLLWVDERVRAESSPSGRKALRVRSSKKGA